MSLLAIFLPCASYTMTGWTCSVEWKILPAQFIFFMIAEVGCEWSSIEPSHSPPPRVKWSEVAGRRAEKTAAASSDVIGVVLSIRRIQASSGLESDLLLCWTWPRRCQQGARGGSHLRSHFNLCRWRVLKKKCPDCVGWVSLEEKGGHITQKATWEYDYYLYQW